MTGDHHNRPLTDVERRLARWMLEHGTTAEAEQYLAQLERAEVTPWKCRCGCVTMKFQIQGHAMAPPGVHILGDFLIGEGNHQGGAFIYSSNGLLSGIEFYGTASDAPRRLPLPEDLRPYSVLTVRTRSPKSENP
jgi:hypothetical protein